MPDRLEDLLRARGSLGDVPQDAPMGRRPETTENSVAELVKACGGELAIRIGVQVNASPPGVSSPVWSQQIRFRRESTEEAPDLVARQVIRMLVDVLTAAARKAQELRAEAVDDA